MRPEGGFYTDAVFVLTQSAYDFDSLLFGVGGLLELAFGALFE